jgi:hypothetical protein
MEFLENEILFREAEQLVGAGVQPFFDKLAQVLVGEWTATGTITAEGEDELFKAGDNFTMVASLRLAAGGKAIVGSEKLTVVNRPNVSTESFVMISWDPVEMAVWIIAPWSDGSTEIGNLTSMEGNGFRGNYFVHMPDGSQKSCEIAMEMESNDKFAWVLKSGPRAGQCLSTWQRTSTSAAGQ